MKVLLRSGSLKISALFFLIFLSGCASGPGDLRPIAEDPVCRYNRDLGCVRVRVSEDTPRAEYLGKNYYFCREGCREVFLQEPARYLPDAGKAGQERLQRS